LSHNTSITDFKTLARTISVVENEAEGFESVLQHLHPNDIPVVGFTGPPGAGKSTLLNAVVSVLLEEGKKIGLVLVDPSSPFNLGAVLGDRLRMSTHFNNPHLFIRSVASRGSLGGLSDKIMEVVEVMKSYPFDFIFVETGLMEIADIFVVNKADRADADALINSLSFQLHLNQKENIPVLKTVAVEGNGVKELITEIVRERDSEKNKERKLILLAEKALRIIAKHRMKNFDVLQLKNDLQLKMDSPGFNLYSFIRHYQ
jgi:LAO/AO transport system kinase